MNRERRIKISLCFNIALFILGLIGLIWAAYKRGIPYNFVFYTQDSNIFLFFSVITMIIYEIRSLRRKEYVLPKWVVLFKYYATVTVTLTFLITVSVLAPNPLSGGFVYMMFENSNLFLHTLCPLPAIVVFLFFEKDYLAFDTNDENLIKIKHTFYSLIPTLVYAAFLYPLNIAGIVYGPYPFFLVNELGPFMSIVWAVLILAGVYLISFLLKLGNQKIKC